MTTDQIPTEPPLQVPKDEIYLVIRPRYFKKCPVCKEKCRAGTHEKVCRKNHRWAWFKRDIKGRLTFREPLGQN